MQQDIRIYEGIFYNAQHKLVWYEALKDKQCVCGQYIWSKVQSILALKLKLANKYTLLECHSFLRFLVDEDQLQFLSVVTHNKKTFLLSMCSEELKECVMCAALRPKQFVRVEIPARRIHTHQSVQFIPESVLRFCEDFQGHKDLYESLQFTLRHKNIADPGCLRESILLQSLVECPQYMQFCLLFDTDWRPKRRKNYVVGSIQKLTEQDFVVLRYLHLPESPVRKKYNPAKFEKAKKTVYKKAQPLLDVSLSAYVRLNFKTFVKSIKWQKEIFIYQT